MSLVNTCFNSLSFFLWTLIAHILLCRIANKKKFLSKGLGLGIFVSLIYIACIFLNPDFNLIGLYLFFTLWITYIAVFINMLNSITLKMLENLYLNPSENNKKKIISKSFNSKRGFESRLLMLKDNKFINYKNNVINLTAKGKWLLKIIKFIQNILLIN